MKSPFFDLETFRQWIQETFVFLHEEEGFEQLEMEETQYRYLGNFLRKGMLVQVEYSLKNDTIDVGIFRDPEMIPLIPVNYREASALSILLTYHRFPYAYYDSLMPYNKGGVRESLAALAEVFKQYALDITRGQEWVSIEMVRSGKRSEQKL